MVKGFVWMFACIVEPDHSAQWQLSGFILHPAIPRFQEFLAHSHVFEPCLFIAAVMMRVTANKMHLRNAILLYCIVSINLDSTSRSANQLEVLSVRGTLRKESGPETMKRGAWAHQLIRRNVP